MNWLDLSIGILLGVGVCAFVPGFPGKLMAFFRALRHIKPKMLLQFNVVWSALMLATYIDLAIIVGFTNSRGVVIAVSAAYVIVAVLALRLQRWAVAVSIVAAIFVTVRFLPFFAEHVWYFFSHPDRAVPVLFHDWLVAFCTATVLGLVTAVPAAVLCSLYLLRLRDIRSVLRFGRASA